MATRQPYSRAPITEAILDLRVEPREDLTLTDLERCHASEEEAYPNKLILRRAAGHMHWEAQESSRRREAPSQ